MDRVPMTPEGHAALTAELNALKAERPKISQEIGIARDHGDLKENAEYHAAKDKQGMCEARIADIEDKLSRADVIDPSTLGGEKVKFGAFVELEDIDNGKIVTYRLVGPDESDLKQGKISITSPVARAIVGKEVGDEVRSKRRAAFATTKSATSAGIDGSPVGQRASVPTLLDHPVETLPGIGPTTGAHLRKRGYASVGDLLWLLPRGYDDQRQPTPIHRSRTATTRWSRASFEGRAPFRAAAAWGSRRGSSRRTGRPRHDGYRELKLVWFRAIPGLGRRFAEGETVRVAGRVHDYRGTATIAHPESLAADVPGAIEPRYPEIPGVRRKALRRAVRAAVDRAVAEVPDLIPPALRAELGVGTVGEALRGDPRSRPGDLRCGRDAEPTTRRTATCARRARALGARASARGGPRSEAVWRERFAIEPRCRRASGAFPFELTARSSGPSRR